MRKALILGLTLAAALSLSACGKAQTEPPEPDPAAVSAPAGASVPTPSADPAPPAGAGSSSQELPGDDSPLADDANTSSVPAETEENQEEDRTEPQQSPPETDEEDPSAQQSDPTEEAPQQPDPGSDPVGPSDGKADGFAVSKEMMALIQAYLSGQQEGAQQSVAGRDPTDFSGNLGAYQEYLDQIQNPEELREMAETLFPGVSDYDIDWDAVWQTVEAGRSS